MYLGNDDSFTYHDSDGTQHHTQGNFLLLLAPDDEHGVTPETMRACVRQVALEQVGHYMMGTARIGGESITVSGTYGDMGLPTSVPREVWQEYGTPVPEDLYEKWNTGGGHNTGGTEAEALREWALDNLEALTPA